jgi:hypothetical protein
MTTFLELQTEFYARGYDYMNDAGTQATRAKAWLNQSYLELCEEELWPFLLTTATGAAPLTIADIRTLYTVVDTAASNVLAPAQEDELIDTYTTLTTTGTPLWFYVADTVVKTYPVGGTLSARYWKVPAELSANGDVAVVPQRFCNLIVDGAVRRAGNDNDDTAGAQRAEDERQRGIDVMRRSLLLRGGLRYYQRITGASEDW